MVNIGRFGGWLRGELRRGWSASAPLTATSLLMLAGLAAFGAGIFLDARVIAGAPAWMKPAKFALSTAIYCATMAWLIRYFAVWPRLTRAAGWTISVVLVTEVAIIAIQAARGKASHFNAETALDAVLFSVMGVAIAILWLASTAILAALFRQRFANPEWGWWLRTGMLVTLIGSAAGGMMLRATPEQAETLRSRSSVEAIGAHTVGAPDGGPGLPVVGWSTTHGDLRIPHFVGLHGVQVIPLIGWLVMRKRRVQTRPALPLIAGASYLALIGILSWQALRGQSIVSPDEATVTVFGIWLSLTAAFVSLPQRRPVYETAVAGTR